MKVFISWSGEASLGVATALRDWLPTVIQRIEPWMSDRDIPKGADWWAEVRRNLKEAEVGVICLTPDNRESPWLLFEGGAIAREFETSKICTYLHKLVPSDIEPPFSFFQGTTATKDDTEKLLNTLNGALGKDALTTEQLKVAFRRGWEELERSLKSVGERKQSVVRERRSEREMLQELIQLTRDLSRFVSAKEGSELGRLLTGSVLPQFVDYELLGRVVDSQMAKKYKNEEEAS